jgi:hypothetical protein
MRLELAIRGTAAKLMPAAPNARCLRRAGYAADAYQREIDAFLGLLPVSV